MKVLFLSLFPFLTCLAQETIVLKGTVVDAATGAPISYASLVKNGIMAMSNEEGRFVFKISAGDKKGSIHVSHIGYTTIAIPVDENIKVIKLEKKISALSEVVVKGINPLELVKKAIAKIPDNYPVKPYVLGGFYRVTGRKEKSIVDLSEAVFDVYNETYARKNKQFKVIRARLDQDFTAFGGVEGLSFGATPEGIIESDIVSNAGESGLLSKEGLNDHTFTYKGVVDYEGREAHKIIFEQKDGVKKSLDDGILYISVDDLAFLHVSQYKNPNGLKYWDFGFKQKMLLKLSGIRVDRLQDSGYITYSRYGNKYYPSHMYGISRWHIVGGRKYFDLNPLYLKFNYIVTKIDTSDVEAFKHTEVLSHSKMLETLSPDNTDSTDAFWGNYNLILPDFNVDSAAKVIRANNETLRYKNMLERALGKYKNDKATRIDSILSFYYQKGQFNGTALIKYQGKVIYEKGFGWANIEKKLPNAGQTQFRIGSTSKQFTSMLVMQLANEGKLKVEDTIGRFIPGYRNGGVAIQQLMSHQSGIPDYLLNDGYVADILTNKYSPDELVKKFCSDTLAFRPGTQISYSNSGFVILAAIIEKITGKKYDEVLTENIFAPLGMKHSYFEKKDHDTANLAIGYVNEERELTYPVENEIGAGGITSTAEDLLLWHDALSSGKLLPKEKMDELFAPRVEWKEWGAYYGYGWMVDKTQFEVSKKHTIQYHPGTEVGFYDMLVRQPDKDIFIILLNNKSDFPRFDITDLILNQLN